MCAIYGIIGKTNSNLIDKISKKQIYRGPDQQNSYQSIDNLTILGNNRLAVIDKDNGKQPMKSEDGRFTIVFNGCIYNFLEIKDYLKNKNVNFKTNSDTEVLLNAYIYFGEEIFNYLDGMWAVAIYDSLKKKCILSRDYVGQKPLYYSLQKEYLLFSSELTGIFEDKNIDKSINRQNLQKYFAYSFVHAPNTIFKNIFQLKPGELIKIDAKTLKLEKKQYWDIADGPDFNIFNKQNINLKFTDYFNEIIEKFTIADKKIAISLSGGLDSNIIFSSLINQKIIPETFSLGFESSTFDETKEINTINNSFKKNILIADKEVLTKKFLEISRLINEPNGDSSILPTYIIFNKIKDYTNVCLGGDGGDESFYGYITFDALMIASKLKYIFPNKFLKICKDLFKINDSSENYLSKRKKIKKFFGSLDLENKYLLPSWMACMSLDDLSKKFNEKININDLYDETHEIFNKNFSLLKSAQIYYFKYYLPMVLAKVDQASMFNSVESRAPFLSKKVINFSLSQKDSTLYSIFNNKKFLRKTYKNILPANIIDNKKHGFAFPTHTILKNDKFVRDLMNMNLIENNKFFENKYQEYLDNKNDNSQYLWNEIVLNLSLNNLNTL
jgi:asparagine synthase (glutamine-hydrolysing)